MAVCAQQPSPVPDGGFSGIDLVNPVNRYAPLNKSLDFWYLMLPRVNDVGSGSGLLRDLVKTNNATYTSMAIAPTSSSGPGRTTRLGGYAQVNFDGSNDYLLTTQTFSVDATSTGQTVALWFTS